MRFPHLFEFMDQSWVPASIRTTLLEILHFSDSPPFQNYYGWVADETLRIAEEAKTTVIVELGAGTAPLTKLLVADKRATGLTLLVCDLTPEAAVYDDLRSRFPGQVQAIYEPVDVSQPRSWEPGTLLVLSATFHHLPPAIRPAVIRALTASADRVLVTEPVRKQLTSILFCLCSIVPSLLLPLAMLARPGRLRRILWCWLLPVAPVMFWWEGFISCLRQWSDPEWDQELRVALAGTNRPWKVSHRLFYQLITW